MGEVGRLWSGSPGGHSGRAVAPQRQNVPHTLIPVAAKDCINLIRRVAHTCQVRHHRKAGLPVQTQDKPVGVLSGTAPRTVGHAHVAGLERH